MIDKNIVDEFKQLLLLPTEKEQTIAAISTFIVKQTGSFCLYSPKQNTFYFPDEALEFMTDSLEEIIKRICSVKRIVYTSGIGLVK